MLQQTQVETVIPYFQRFIAAFPELSALAAASLDEVLALWSGLGYYARARNLHATAQRCMSEYQGRLPLDPEVLISLPGIGRSTANAIAAQAGNLPVPILDGNVRRVLARHAGIEGWPGRSAVERALWRQAEMRMPTERAADYTQAIMDLGATLCTRSRPACERCPVAVDCIARMQGLTDRLPTPRPRRSLPQRQTTLLLLQDTQAWILLERRPPQGIWGGLWSLPTVESMLPLPQGLTLPAPKPLRHVFTHFILDIHLQRIQLQATSSFQPGEEQSWHTLEAALQLGLPQPIRRLLEALPCN